MNIVADSDNPVLTVQTATTVQALHINQIMYAESFGRSLLLHCSNDERPVMCRMPISEAEQKLAPYHFLRIQKSYLVNMAYILSMNCHGVTLRSGALLPISKKWYSALHAAFLQWCLQHGTAL